MQLLQEGKGTSVRAWSCICLLWFIKTIAFTQPIHVIFEHHSVEDGLAMGVVQAIIQDRQGFMWFGTRDGLNRYDGYEYITYRNDPNDPTTISGNNIETLYEDSHGYIWIGTRGSGLSRFHPEKAGGFTQWLENPDDYESLSSNRVADILSDRQGRIWVGTRYGIDIWRESHPDQFIHIKHDPDDTYTLPAGGISRLTRAADGAIWVGFYTGGLARIEPSTLTLERIIDPAASPTPAQGISDLAFDAQNRLWLGGRQGLRLLEFTEDAAPQITTWLPDPQRSDSLPVKSVTDLYIDQYNLMWIATYGGGMARMDLEKPGSFRTYQHESDDPDGISLNEVKRVYRDRSGTIWAGVYGGPLNRLDPDREAWRHFHHIATQPGSLSHDHISSVVEDAAGGLWVGGFVGGLNYRPSGQDAFMHFNHDPDDPNSLTGNGVYCVQPDSLQRLWVGTYDGLNLMDLKTTGQFKRFIPSSEADSISGPWVKSVFEDSNRNIWVATASGLNRTSLDNPGSFEAFRHRSDQAESISHNHTQVIHEDTQGILWIGTRGGGLNRMDPDNPGVFTRYEHHFDDLKSLPNNIVWDLFEDDHGLWIATADGLALMTSPGSFRTWREKDGLPNSYVNGVLGDDSGNIWISTNGGLSRIDLKKNQISKYTTSDGLMGNQFNYAAAAKGNDGRFYFGGTSGLTAFFPHAVLENTNPPDLAFTDLLVLNKSIRVSSESKATLQQPIAAAPPVRFKPEQNIFSVEFAALHYAAPEKNRYRYRLTNFNEEWIEADATQRRATFTNLDPGDYALEVQAANKDGIWGQQTLTLPITIIPPPWLTWWAKSLYLIALTSLLFGYIAWQRSNRRLLSRLVEKRTQELREKNDQLELQYKELSGLERIVETVNREIDLHTLVQTMLNQGGALVQGAERGLCILWSNQTNRFEVAASIGYDPEQIADIHYSYKEIASCKGKKISISDGVYIIPDQPDILKKYKLPKPVVSLVVSLTDNSRIQAELIFHNYTDPSAFDHLDPQPLVRFRTHALAAITKARAMEDLIEAQQEFMDAAHEAGMAEIATEVLHNVGNTLNSVRSSSHTITSITEERRWRPLFKRIIDHYENPQEAKLGPNETAKALRRILEGIDNDHAKLDAESIRLQEHVQNIVNVLRQQEHYATLKTGLVEATTIESLFEEAARAYHLEDYLTIHRDFPKGMPRVQLERTRFKRVLFYLFDNAREAITEAEIKGHLCVGAIVKDHSYQFTIQDNGVGIGFDQLERVFNHGYTTKQNFRGFGLHYCANTIKEMGGSIQIHSDGIGKGATVTLTLPINAPVALAS